MNIACRVGARGLGLTAPNPSVGCVIVREGRIISTAHTAPSGRPHAEVIALSRAGEQARGSDIYVTLEPCAHFGKTPPCVQAIINAGVRRVFIGNIDPAEHVSGKGIAMLERVKIEVAVGVCNEQARRLHEGFFSSIMRSRPMVALKMATSMDGKIATKTKDSKWITGVQARNMGHMLRAQYDAIMVGIGTVLQDDPMLDCRLDGMEAQSPMRVILDGRLRIPVQSQLLQTAGRILTTVIHDPMRKPEGDAQKIFDLGVQLHPIPHMKMEDVLGALAKMGVTRLLVEGGAQLATSLAKDDLIDKIYHFQAPIYLGADGINAVGNLPHDIVRDAPKWRVTERRTLGDDMLTVLRTRNIL